MCSRAKHTAIVGGWNESDKDFGEIFKKSPLNKFYILYY